MFTPGDHGNTFGGNSLASAVALAALDVLESENLAARSKSLGAWLLDEFRAIRSPALADVRGRGLFIGLDIDARFATARQVVERLLAHGILSKDTHGTVVRIAPPLTIGRDELAWAAGEIVAVLRETEARMDGSA